MINSRYDRAKKYGSSVIKSSAAYYRAVCHHNALDAQFVTWERNPAFKAPCVPKEGSHDSGPFTGFFFGGFGTASFARGATGFFDRWQLRQGVPVICPMDNACFELRWACGEEVKRRKLRVAEDGFKADEMEYHALFPLAYETYHAEDMPFSVTLEGYSPVIPHNLKDSILPVTLFNLYVSPKEDGPVDISVCLCWPNVLGWEQPYQSSEMRPDAVWPSHQNSGNYAQLDDCRENTVHIRQAREEAGQANDLSGEIMLSMKCDGWIPSYDVMFKETRVTTGYADEEQIHTIGKMHHDLEKKGQLSNYDESWQAHWHEPTASALCAKTVLSSKSVSLTFAVTMALPITQFGMGRRWQKLYTENPELSSAHDIASYALDKNHAWLQQIDRFHSGILEAEVFKKHLAGAKINELYFLTSGGTVLVSKPVGGWDEETSRLGKHPHFGLLEGFDTGYYYYNTLDLWVYAFAALSRHWPELAEWGFADYLSTASMTESRQNMIYRDRKKMDNMIWEKLPHDLGGCAEDLFVRLNGYNFRDTPNMWKDHNPSFILAFYLHKKISGSVVCREEYHSLKTIMDFTIGQDADHTGIPRHTQFGDSTWDNLHMQGLSAYCGCLCIGAYAVMEKLAGEFSDPDQAMYGERLRAAQKTIRTLWNGTYYVTSEFGKYSRAVMADALFGLLLAKKAGLGCLLPEEEIKSHLQAAYQNNAASFCGGKFGALLVAEPGIQNYEKDGGDELQVNEVIVGSSQILAASLREFGLYREAQELSESMAETIAEYGLQFRTPAAWNQSGQFRAPMNMRPLAIWL